MSTEMSTDRRAPSWASGPILLASGILVVVGIMQVFMGTTALVHDAIYVDAPRYLYSFDLTVWGWVHLLAGTACVAAGYAGLRGRTWARMVGIGLASFGMIAQFAFVPHYPFWSLLVIVLDVVVIYGMAVSPRSSTV